MAVTWRGENRSGTGSVGSLPADADLIEFVEAKYQARWRWLTVERDGAEVGAIVDHPDDGRRIWWADGAS